MRIGHGAGGLAIGRDPLGRAGRALGLHPVEGEQVFEILHREGGRRRSPGAFEPAGHRILADAGAAAVLPAEALLLGRSRRRRRADALVGRMGAMRLAEAVAAGDQRQRFLVVHRHPAEGFADVLGRRQRVAIAVGAFRIDVDEAHLDGAERPLQRAVGAIAFIGEELGFRAPVNDVGLPIIGAAAAEAIGLEAHLFRGDVAGQHHQVGPAERAAVLQLDRLQQAACLVEIGVVGPGVQRLEALLPAAGAAAAIGDAIGAGAVPGHADEERAVIAIVRRPPGLRRRQHLRDVLLHCGEIELLEGGGVIEIATHRVRFGAVLAQRRQVEQIGPPELVGDRAFGRLGHGGRLCWRLRCGSAGPEGQCGEQQERFHGHCLWSPRTGRMCLPCGYAVIDSNQRNRFFRSG